LSIDRVIEFYSTHVAKLEEPVALEEMQQLSKQLSEDVGEYRHNELQAALAGVIVSHNKPVTIVVSPTGSGKTWIEGMVAKHYCNGGERVLIIEPNELLSAQTAVRLEAVDFAITVTSITRFLVEGLTHKVVILNEYDLITT
jgi:superfamily II DNA or RNA helicase